MNYTIRIKRQENPQASPCWQEFSFEGSADTSIASVLNELNHRSPLCEKSGTVVSPIAWECGCMIRKCGACAMRIDHQLLCPHRPRDGPQQPQTGDGPHQGP